MGVKSLWRSGAAIRGLTLESRRFMRPTACARLPQSLCRAKQRDPGCAVWPITAHGRRGEPGRPGEGESVWSGEYERHRSVTSWPPSPPPHEVTAPAFLCVALIHDEYETHTHRQMLTFTVTHTFYSCSSGRCHKNQRSSTTVK